jgi:hypothetical protein
MRELATIALLSLSPTACSSASSGEAPSHASAPPPGTPPPGFSGKDGPPAVLRIDGREVAFGNVFAQRLPNSDTTRFTLVSSADITCETLPKRADQSYVGEIVVSRFFAREADGKPSKRPLSVSAATFKIDGKESTVGGKSFGPLLEPFVEPTTATVMFGRVELALPASHVELSGTLMAQVCLPATSPCAIENLQPKLELSYVGTKVRVRSATLTAQPKGGSELRIASTPLSCDAEAQGDLEIRIALDGKGEASPPRIAGLAVEDSALAKASFNGQSRASKRGSDIELDIKGSVGGSDLMLSGAVTPRKCP